MKKLYYYLILKFINTFFLGTHFFNFKRIILNHIGIKIGKNTKIVGPLKIGRVASLEIGDNCWIGTELSIYGNGSVKIEDNCDLAPKISFFTGSHVIGNNIRRAGEGLILNFIVKKGVWIGGNVNLFNGINIEKMSIIAGGSVVIKDVEPNVLMAGVPAEKKRDL